MAPVGTIPTRTELGASTTTRKWCLDVDSASSQENPTWLGVFGIQQITPRPFEATTQDDSDMDGGGYKSQTTTALTWGVDGKVLRKVTADEPTEYDPGQQVIKAKAKGLGSAGRIHFRFYEYTDATSPVDDGYEGWGTVTWSEDGGDMTALDIASFSITGSGKPTEVSPSTETV